MKVSNFFSLGKVLIAVAAIGLAAPSAKADLTFSLTSGTTTDTFHTSGDTLSLSGSLTIGNVTVTDFTVTENAATGKLSVTLDATSSSASTLQFTALTGIDFTGPTGQAKLAETLSGSGAALTQFSSYNGMPGPFLSTTSSTSGTSASFTSTVPFSLSTMGTLTSSAGGALHINTTAQVIGVPEPTGVIAALAGLPCMGLVVGFARRRRAVEPAAM